MPGFFDYFLAGKQARQQEDTFAQQQTEHQQDRQYAMQDRQAQQQQAQEARRATVGQFVHKGMQALANARPEARPIIYKAIVAEMRQYPEAQPWLEYLPADFDEAQVMPVVQQGLAQTGLYADQGKPQGPMNVSPGGAVIDPSTGKLIYQNNNFAPQRPIWDSVRGGWVMPPGGGQQSMPSPPAGQSNVQFDFAEGTSPEVQAAIRAAASADQAGQMPPGAEMPQEAPVRPGPGFIPVVPPRQPAGAAKVEVPGNPALHGDAYLATLPPEMRSLVKAIADGNQAPPSASSRSPQAQALLQAVYAYDPSMSAINLPARTQTRKDFTSGKSAQNLRALNQAIGHLGMLNGQIGGTAGHSIPVIGHMVNEAQNAYAYASGDPGITNFKQTAAALAGELTQVFRGNSGAEADLARFLQELDAANSTEQKTAAVRNIVGLLNSRIEELGQQYSQGMGKITDPYSLLNPHAAEVLRGVMGGGKQGKGAQKAGWAIEEVP